MSDVSQEQLGRFETGRMIAFSDGVVAIAATLLILPLADIELTYPEQGNPLGWIWENNRSLIEGFIISWLVILVFWLAHHRMFNGFDRLNTRVILWNVLFLFAIVVLPFPTNLLTQIENRDGLAQATVFYMLILFVMSASLLMIGQQARKNPDLVNRNSQTWRKDQFYRGWVISAYMAVLVVASAFVPQYSIYGPLGITVAVGIYDVWIGRRPDRSQSVIPNRNLQA